MIVGFKKSFCWHPKCWNSKYFWYLSLTIPRQVVSHGGKMVYILEIKLKERGGKRSYPCPLTCCVKDGPGPLWLVETSSSNREDEWTGFHVICWRTRGIYLSLTHPDSPLRKSSCLWAHSKQRCSILCVCSLSHMSRPRSRHLVENSHSVTWPTIWMD